MKRIRKSVYLPLLLLVMGIAFYVYFGIYYNAWSDNLPNILIFIGIIVLLAWTLRKKEKLEEERENDIS